jgi:predicted DsbA family dithiol-disulfide isomerase
MEFTGRIFFNFETHDVWRIYSTLVGAARTGSVQVAVTWKEFLVDEVDPAGTISPKVRALAACAAVRAGHEEEQHQRFVQALLTLIFEEKDDPRADTTLAVAAKVAGIDPGEVISRAIDPGVSLLRAGSAAAREIGVSDVPTIVGSGPPLLIKTSGAANYGNPVRRLELIHHMLHDDGVWMLKKPD